MEQLLSLVLAAIAVGVLKLLHKELEPYFYPGLAAIACFNIADIITTHLARNVCGYQELNPIFNWLFEIWGVYAYVVKLLGVLLILGFFIILWRFMDKSKIFVLLIIYAVFYVIFYSLILSLGNSINVIICSP